MLHAREQMLLHYLNQLPWDLAIEMAEHHSASAVLPCSFRTSEQEAAGKQYLFLLAWNKGVCDQ